MILWRLRQRLSLSVRASLVAAIGGILFGYDMGIISGALLQLREQYHMSCLLQEVVVSSVLFGALLSSLLGGAVIDLMGRKHTMIINCIFFIIGAVMMSLTTSIALLVAGRVLVGVAVGLSVIAECAYISEITTAEHRGKMVSLNEVAIALGFLLAYLINYMCIMVRDGWRWMFGLSGVLALVQCLALISLPKSPRFLLIKGHDLQALKVLNRLREREDIAKEELSRLQRALSAAKQLGWQELFSLKDNMWFRLLIGFGLVLFQQCSGLPSVLYYSPLLLKHMGFESDQAATFTSLGTGVVKAAAVVVSLFLVDKVGRKKLLVSGCLLLATSLFAMSQLNKHVHLAASKLCDGRPPVNSSEMTGDAELTSTSTAVKVISLLSMFTYAAAYSISFGPVTWLLLSEIFPASIKGRAVAFIAALNWAINLLVSFTFLNYLDRVGLDGAFITYSISCCLATVFVILLVPETKGRDLEEINNSLSATSVADLVRRQLLCRNAVPSSNSYQLIEHSPGQGR